MMTFFFDVGMGNSCMCRSYNVSSSHTQTTPSHGSSIPCDSCFRNGTLLILSFKLTKTEGGFIRKITLGINNCYCNFNTPLVYNSTGTFLHGSTRVHGSIGFQDSLTVTARAPKCAYLLVVRLVSHL